MDLLTIAQKLLKKLHHIKNIGTAVVSDHASFIVLVMQWRLEVILPTVQHKEYSHGFWDSHHSINRKLVSSGFMELIFEYDELVIFAGHSNLKSI